MFDKNKEFIALYVMNHDNSISRFIEKVLGLDIEEDYIYEDIIKRIDKYLEENK